MKAALYILHYIHSSHDYGISFTSDKVNPKHSYIHYPPATDVEAYNDALPPSHGRSNTLSAYSNACWDLQLGSVIADGTLLPLFMFCSMSGGIIFRSGGPLSWLGERQARMSLSSCKAKICATCAMSKKIVDLCNLARSISHAGLPVTDIFSPMVLHTNGRTT